MQDSLKIVICDDDATIVALLERYARKLAKALSVSLDVKTYSDGAALVDGYQEGADLLLIDVEMPLCNGIEASQEIRNLDAGVCIVFVTSYEQYAISGYRVGAYRYLVKPVTYDLFVEELAEIFEELSQEKSRYLSIKTDGGFMRLRPRDICYVETLRDHRIAVHSKDGCYVAYKSIAEVEGELAENSFFRCHRSYLINFRYVVLIGVGEVRLEDGSTIPVSKYRKQEFQREFAAYAVRMTLSSKSR